MQIAKIFYSDSNFGGKIQIWKFFIFQIRILAGIFKLHFFFFFRFEFRCKNSNMKINKNFIFQICSPDWCFADQGMFCCNDGCCNPGMNCCIFNGYQRCTFLNCDD